MLRAVRLFIYSFLVPLVLTGQTIDENVTKDVKMYIGVSPGLYLSKLIPGDDGSHSHSGNIDVTYENIFIPGFQLGCSFEKRKSNSFFLQTEIYFNHTHHDIVYHDWSVSGLSSTLKSANYTIYYSTLGFSLFPTLSLGKEKKFSLFGGPYISIPLSSIKDGEIKIQSGSSTRYLTDDSIDKDIHGGMGLVFGIRLDFPVGTNLLSPELRVGRSLNYVTENPNICENFYVIGIRYLIKI
jgi:hypothetical protein